MTLTDNIEHALGAASLFVMASAGGYSVYAIAATVAPQWRRIVRLAAGNIEPAIAPVPPAAPATPHVASTPSRRGVGAAAAPAFQVCQ